MADKAKTSGDDTRRDFMKKSAGAAAAGMLIGTSKSWAGANDRIRVAVCGVKGRGGSHIDEFIKMDNVDVTTLCDIDEAQLARRSAEIVDRGEKKPKCYYNFRDVMADPDVDVVSIATPNHLHSLIGILACQAGKDVYVEKPLSHNVWEGRQLVRAARKYKCIVQHGTQTRSSPGAQEGIRRMHEGLIGEVYMGKGLCYKWRNTIGRTPDGPVPDGVHYDQWKGPAPDKPFSENRFHYNWHWQWEYGNGDIGNQGVHQMDVCRWGLQVDMPSRVQSMGGHYMFDDDQTTPNTLISTMEFPAKNLMLVFEVRHWITNYEGGLGKPPDNNVGNIFWGSEGYMTFTGSAYKSYLGRDRKPGPSASGGGNHFANFMDAVRSRNRAELNAEVEEGHYSSALCHLANIAYRAGETIRMDPEKETIVGNRKAKKMIDGSDRDYRKGYEVPKKV